ncbi:MAG: cobalamin adenosyltransferase, partial [Oscillibacter sp.]|nr:cobalamin adenosyltransferase [Oscillibacter sp.]
AEVKEEPLTSLRILGMDSGELRRCSHQVKEVYGIGHPVPSYEMGPICAQLNLLRTQVRETELSAARAFERADGTFDRADLIEGLNRLSSAVYILFCRKVSGWYEQQGGGNA